jgi:hypothetical protein
VLLSLGERFIIFPLVVIILQGILAFVSRALWLPALEASETGQAATWMLVLIVLAGIPVGYLVYFSKERLLVVVNSLVFMFMSFCLLFLPLESLPYVEAERAISALVNQLALILMFPICWMAVILFSPLKSLTRRLGFVVLGVLTLVALSEISKLNLHQYLQPPKLSDNLLRQPFTSIRPT